MIAAIILYFLGMFLMALAERQIEEYGDVSFKQEKMWKRLIEYAAWPLIACLFAFVVILEKLDLA